MNRGRCPRCNRLWQFNIVNWYFGRNERRWVRWMPHVCQREGEDVVTAPSVFLVPLRKRDRVAS